MSLVTEIRMLEPLSGKFLFAVCHVLPAEDAECKHLLRREFGPEARIKVGAFSFCEGVSAVLLHEIVHRDDGVHCVCHRGGSGMNMLVRFL